MLSLSFPRRTWTEIDLDALRHNYDLIRARLKPATKLCCVIKANGYGHGAVMLAKYYEAWGADYFAVSGITEALQLRRSGISRPVVILGYTPPECAKNLADNNVSQALFSEDYAAALSAQAQKAGVTVKVHCKIDTGMGRIGFRCTPNEKDDLPKALASLKLPNLYPEGIFMHFCVADGGEETETFTKEQYASFRYAVDFLEQSGIKFEVRHCANSAAIEDYPDFQFDMVRVGIILYGLKPSDEIRNAPAFRPAMTLKTVISHIKTLEAGDTVGYGRTYTVPAKTKIATLPIGYADGFYRQNAKNGVKVWVNGKPCPIVGRICMDQTMIDLGEDSDLACGEEAVIFGGGDGVPTADDIAAADGTIGYEIVCAVSNRVPRVYKRGGEIVDVQDGLM